GTVLGQVGGGDEAVVAPADHDRVVAVGSHVCRPFLVLSGCAIAFGCLSASSCPARSRVRRGGPEGRSRRRLRGSRSRPGTDRRWATGSPRSLRRGACGTADTP